jgi:hypothetical protein
LFKWKIDSIIILINIHKSNTLFYHNGKSWFIV